MYKALALKLFREKNFLSLLGNFSFSFFGLVSFFFLVRSMDKNAFGEWALFITIATFFDLFRFGLTRNAIIRHISGTDAEEKKQIIGTSFLIGLILVGFFFLILSPLLLLPVNISGGYLLIVKYYPLYALANLSWNNAVSLYQAELMFGRILLVKSFNVVTFLLFLIFNMLFFKLSVEGIILANIFTNLISSAFSNIKGNDGMKYIRRSSRECSRKLINFGKFSIGSVIGSSLLKGADVFIIGLNPILGSAAIAIYSIPLKLIELINIPLVSFMATAFPKMSKSSLENNYDRTRELFYSYSGALTILFFIISVIGFFLAKQLVLLLGGNQYRDSIDLMVLIFRLFIIYGMFLPLDRMYGVALDSLGYPKLNMFKVLVMAFLNIIGDLIMVFIFKSMPGVAVVTIIFTIVGIILGNIYLARILKIKIQYIVPFGFGFYKEFFHKGLSMLK